MRSDQDKKRLCQAGTLALSMALVRRLSRKYAPSGRVLYAQACFLHCSGCGLAAHSLNCAKT